MLAKWADYHDEQIHTWTLTGAPPTPAPRGSAQVYFMWPTTWSVTGSGRKTFPSRTPGATGRDESERWTIANEMNATLRITEIAGIPVRVRIGAEGQRGAPLGSIRVTEVSGRTRDASVQPWQFPTIEDDATSTTLSGTSTRTYPEGFGVGWGQPPKAITTATCTWSFTRGSVEQSRSNTPPGGRGGRPTGSLAGVSATAPSTTAAQSTATVTGAPLSSVAIEPGDVVDRCTLPITIPPANVRMHPGGVAFQVSGVRTGCVANCALGLGVPNPGATVNEVHFVVHRHDRSNPVVDVQGRPNSVDVRTSMEHGRTYSFTVFAEEFVRTATFSMIRGACGRTQLTGVTPPVPATPVILRAMIYQSAVFIEWACVNQFETAYLMLGPGLPEAGAIGNCGSSGRGLLEFRPVPPKGTYTWVITPFWDTADERVIDVNRGARATMTIP